MVRHVTREAQFRWFNGPLRGMFKHIVAVGIAKITRMSGGPTRHSAVRTGPQVRPDNPRVISWRNYPIFNILKPYEERFRGV